MPACRSDSIVLQVVHVQGIVAVLPQLARAQLTLAAREMLLRGTIKNEQNALKSGRIAHFDSACK